MPRSSFIFCLAVLCIIALFPFPVFAADALTTPEALSAGFATTPIWVSNRLPADGDALKLFAVVNNASATTVSGSIYFLVDGTAVGSEKVSLGAGTAHIVATAWTAVAGSHNISATFLESVAGPISITVADAPPKPLVLQYLDTATNAVGAVAGPALSGAFAAVDGARQSGADYLARQRDLRATNTGTQGQVFGTSTDSLAKSGAAAVTSSTSPDSWFTRLEYLFFNNSLIFYPLLILILIFALWLISRIFSRG